MKKIIYTFILAAIIIGCASTGSNTESTTNGDSSVTSTSDTLRIANDSLEYEILIIEPGFNQWLATQPPRQYYNQDYLEIRNQIMVTNYNQRVLEPSRYNPNLYIQQIQYNSSIDYGYEVNYLLYNWFQFFQQRNNQKLR